MDMAVALGFVDLHEIHTGPLFKPLEVTLEGIPSFKQLTESLNLQPELELEPENLLRVHTITLSVSLMKILKLLVPIWTLEGHHS